MIVYVYFYVCSLLLFLFGFTRIVLGEVVEEPAISPLPALLAFLETLADLTMLMVRIFDLTFNSDFHPCIYIIILITIVKPDQLISLYNSV